jgi:phosphate-selective porin OprO and OprP
MSYKRPRRMLFAGAVTLLLSSHASAQQPEYFIYQDSPFAQAEVASADLQPDEAAQPTIEQLSAEVESLKASLQKLEESAAKSKEQTDAPKSDAKEKSGDKSSEKAKDDKKDKEPEKKWIDTSTEKWTVRLGGHLQSDFVQWAGADDAIPNDQNYFEFRRVRLLADGTGYGNLDFRLQMTMEPETTSPPYSNLTQDVVQPALKDAYFSVNDIPLIGRFRIGNFFVPFGLEQVTNDTFNIFLERSIPTQGIFTADREVGIALYNSTDDQRLSWASGVFMDSVSEGLKQKLDDNLGVRVSGRLNYLPYYDETTDGRYLWHTGVGALYTDDSDNRFSFSARPQIRVSPRLINTGNINGDGYTTINFENAFVLGRVTLQTESYITEVDLLDGSSPFVDGTYAHISYFLTGESRKYEKFGQHGAQFGRNTPFSNAFITPAGASWGAWELKARWSHLDLNQLNAGQYNDVSAGFNWYWNDRTRIMFDWIHPMTNKDAAFGAVDGDIIGTRFDFNW